jgi:hypothetical protein
LAWSLQGRKRSTPPACFPEKKTTTKWSEVVMSFGGGWVGLSRKKGGAVPFRIYNSDFRNCTGTTIETGKGFANIFKN